MKKSLIGLENRVVFVTWWTSWMGKATTVLQAAVNGAKVAFIWRRAPEWTAVVQEAMRLWVPENNILYFQCDVTNFTILEAVVKNVLSKWWRIDGLFCCAWNHMVWDIMSTPLEDWNAIWNLNVTSMFMTMKFVLPSMIEQQWGNIVLMWSDQSFIGKKKSSIYGATKAAIGQLTKSTALDYAEYGIRVNAVCPGTIETAQASRAAWNFAQEKFDWDIQKARDDFAQAQAIKRLWSPEEVAELVNFLLSDQAAYMTWTLISIDWWYTAA